MQTSPRQHRITTWRALVPRFLIRDAAEFQRRHERYACVAIGTMTLIEVGATFEGVLLEISTGGCSFRPASLYLLDRIGTEVLIETEHVSARGVIRATRTSSYGIQFQEVVAQETVDHMVTLHGGAAADSFLARPGHEGASELRGG
jgi:hypothetical protein